MYYIQMLKSILFNNIMNICLLLYCTYICTYINTYVYESIIHNVHTVNNACSCECKLVSALAMY